MVDTSGRRNTVLLQLSQLQLQKPTQSVLRRPQAVETLTRSSSFFLKIYFLLPYSRVQPLLARLLSSRRRSSSRLPLPYSSRFRTSYPLLAHRFSVMLNSPVSTSPPPSVISQSTSAFNRKSPLSFQPSNFPVSPMIGNIFAIYFRSSRPRS